MRKRIFATKDKNPAFLVPFVALLGVLLFNIAIKPALWPSEEKNIFHQWEKKLPAGLTGVDNDDLAVCAQWEGEQRRLLHRWHVACCERGLQLAPPRLEDNQFYTDVLMRGPRIIPLLAKRVEWNKDLANPEFINADLAKVLSNVAGGENSTANNARSQDSWVMNR